VPASDRHRNAVTFCGQWPGKGEQRLPATQAAIPPIGLQAWEGEGVVAAFRKVVGATNPLQAEPGTIRGDLARVIGRNIVHASVVPLTKTVIPCHSTPHSTNIARVPLAPFAARLALSCHPSEYAWSGQMTTKSTCVPVPSPALALEVHPQQRTRSWSCCTKVN
jgi:hypothetical protein